MKGIALSCAVPLITALLWCCAVPGPRFESLAEEGRSIIYVYRPFRRVGYFQPGFVTCGAQRVRLRPGQYHAFVLPPGAVLCSAWGKSEGDVRLDIVAGQEAFIKMVTDTEGGSLVVYLRLVDSATGLLEAQKCNLQP